MFRIMGITIASLLFVLLYVAINASGDSLETEGEWPNYGYDPHNTRRSVLRGEFETSLVSEVLDEVIDGTTITSAPIAVNLTGNASLEIVFCTALGTIVAVSPNNGGILWTYKISNHPVRSTPAVSDFDSDGLPELVMGTVEGEVICLDPRTLSEDWMVQLGSGTDSHPVIANVFGDDRPEVFIGSFDGVMYCIDPDGNITWSYPTGYHISNTSAAIGDIYGNGSFVCVFNTGVTWESPAGPKSPFVYYVDAVSGVLLGSYRTRGWASSPTMLVDLDGDGILETIVNDDRVVAISGINDSILWSFPEGDLETGYYRYFACGYFDDSGLPSVIASSGEFENPVVIFDGPTGAMNDLRGLRQPPVCVIDIDGDGYDEVITSTGILDGYPLGSFTRMDGSWNSRSGVVVADLDLDGYAEICRLTAVQDQTDITIWDCLHRQGFEVEVESGGAFPIVYYAGLEMPVDLVFRIGNVTPRSEVEGFEIVLDPEMEAVRFTAFPTNRTVVQENDEETVRMWNGLVGQTPDTFVVTLSLTFGWDFGTSGPFNLTLEMFTRRPGPKNFTFLDIIRVEDRVALIGSPSIAGHDHGPIGNGGWCFPKEMLTITGVRVVYHGTEDLVPPRDGRTILVTDVFGRNWTATPGDDGMLNIAINASETETSSYSITISNRPRAFGARGHGWMNVSIGIDGTPPFFTDHFPHENWFGTGRISAGIVLVDGNGSGPDGVTLKFYLRPAGSRTFPESGAPPDDFIVESDRLSAITALILPDGSNAIFWQVQDHAGNTGTSDVYSINVDTGNLTFRNPGPSIWVRTIEPSVTIDVVEVGGSQIDGDRIDFSYSTSGIMAFSPWMKASAYPDGREVHATESIRLVEGPNNWVMWRASDLAGHILTSSPHRILIDTHPPEILDVRPGPDEVTDGPHINLTARVLDPLSKVNASSVSVALFKGEDPFYAPSLEWSVATVLRINDDEYSCHFIKEIPEGWENYVWWRASDEAGNGYYISGPHRVRVNMNPVINSTTPSDGHVAILGKKIEVAAEVWDPDSDSLTVIWYVDDTFLGEGETNSLYVNRTGDIVIRIEVSDGHNHTVVAEWTLQAVDPPSSTIPTFWIWLMIAVVTAALVLTYSMSRIHQEE